MFLLGIAVSAPAQLLSWTPAFPVANDPTQQLVITVDARKGNKGLLDYSAVNDVYVHIGVITDKSTNPTNWRYVKFDQNFNQPNAQLQAAFVSPNKWKFTISGSLKDYFGVPADETILKVAILFRNGNGSRVQRNADNSDMYVPVYSSALQVRLDQPPSEPRYVMVPEPQNWSIGTNFSLTANASAASDLKLFFNGVQVAAASNTTTITANATVTTNGNQQLIASAYNGSITVYDTLNIFVSPATSPVAVLPAGVQDGINYEPGDTSVTLVLRAPGKNKVSVVGDFSNWQQQVKFMMNKTPDGKFFWLRLHPLTPGTEYSYQYWVDDTIKIADPYTEKVLDPWNDSYISSTTYPNLKAYPAGQSGIVSVLQTRAPAYNWSQQNFNRPDKRGLVIYELLLRDFVQAHDWKTLRDSLSYFKTLGINAIELMPINEFEGNESWGYNPDFYFAPDKYYGPENSLKEFIDSAHQNGIAVIMDIALNHSFGLSPMVQLYWDAANSRPAVNNPWYNSVAKHAFNVGFDFNHESADTKYFVSRVLQHWTQQYKIDGFRFDLSKGFTQKQTCDAAGNNCDVNAWSQYDASRITILKGYYDSLQLKSANAYAILEHFADNTEEKELAAYGMLLWGNMSYNYQEAAMGYVSNSNLDGGLYSTRGWTVPHLVTYAESHDEERVMYKTINFGNASGSYNTRDTATALKRMSLDAAFLFMLPGPKMMWQFGELGYDYSINACPNGTISNDCRLANKPIRWDYLNDSRRKAVYNNYSKLINLRFHPWYKGVFVSGTLEKSLGGAFKWIKLRSAADSSDVVVVGNFDVDQQNAAIDFPVAGTWYDYLNNTTLSVSGSSAETITLQPGEFRVLVNRNVNNIAVTPVPTVPPAAERLSFTVFPNPSRGVFTLECRLPQSSAVTVRLFSTTGQDMGELYNGFVQQGTRQLPLTKAGMPAGAYFLRIQTKTEIKTLPVHFQ